VGRIHYDQVTLEELVRQSPLVVAGRLEGFSPVEVPLTSVKGEDRKKHPPFSYSLCVFDAVEVLKSDGPGKIEGRIDVQPAHLGTKFSVYKKYHLEKVSKSPIYEVYGQRKPLEKGQRYILFLSWGSDLGPEREAGGPLFRFTADNAFEAAGEEPNILRLIKSIQKKD
jgi:hypothetical protein